MKPDFSEFSYGYAVTEELVAQHKATIIAAPLFPSLYDEGQIGGGYDVKIPLVGIPVFLQFKLSDQLRRPNAKEHRDGLLGLPYYRMHLRPIKHSNQHNLLLDLEASGEAVFYIAPEFHIPAELNAYYLSRSVVAHSAVFSPQAIGRLPDDDEHYIVFEPGSAFGYRCSTQPERIIKTTLHNGLRSVLTDLGVEARNVGEDGLREISQRMLQVLIAGEKRLRSQQKCKRPALPIHSNLSHLSFSIIAGVKGSNSSIRLFGQAGNFPRVSFNHSSGFKPFSLAVPSKV